MFDWLTLPGLLAFSHVPIGAYIVYRAVMALRVATDKRDRFSIECILAMAATIAAVRATDYTPVQIDGEAYTMTWRFIVAVSMLAVVPLLNSVTRLERERKKE